MCLVVVIFIEEAPGYKVLCVIDPVAVGKLVQYHLKALSGLLILFQLKVQIPQGVVSILSKLAVRIVIQQFSELRL